MESLACCFTDEETPYCPNRRFESLPMCKRHMHDTMRTAVFDALMPWDVMRDIAKLAADVIKMRELEMRSLVAESTAQREDAMAEQVAENKRKLGVVYYVRVSPEHIKIGRTINLKSRMSSMRVRRAQVLAAEPGGEGQESRRHAQFAGIRDGRREDFQATQDLLAHVKAVREQWGDPWGLEA